MYDGYLKMSWSSVKVETGPGGLGSTITSSV